MTEDSITIALRRELNSWMGGEYVNEADKAKIVGWLLSRVDELEKELKEVSKNGKEE